MLFKKKTKKVPIGRYSCKSDVGKVRVTNEDRVAAKVNSRGDIFLVVCDGMGGQNKGELASSIAVNHLVEDFVNARFLSVISAQMWLNRKIRAVNRYIYDEARKNPLYKGMGTTLSAVIIFREFMVIAQIGDSRVYQIDNGEFTQLTKDQTYVEFLYNNLTPAKKKLVRPGNQN